MDALLDLISDFITSISFSTNISVGRYYLLLLFLQYYLFIIFDNYMIFAIIIFEL